MFYVDQYVSITNRISYEDIQAQQITDESHYQQIRGSNTGYVLTT